jgi:hypothetical protein
VLIQAYAPGYPLRFYLQIISGVLYFRGASDTILIQSGNVVANGVWQHIQLARFGGYLYLWLDGIIVARAANTTDIQFSDVPGLLLCSDTSSTYDGAVDAHEIRTGYVNRGVIVENDVPYARDFPVPTREA